jgi:hypothetical protein
MIAIIFVVVLISMVAIAWAMDALGDDWDLHDDI